MKPLVHRASCRYQAILAAAAVMVVSVADAAPLLHDLFQDHVVLQRDRSINVWGSAPANDDLTVSIAGASTNVRADQSGRWRASLPAMKAGGPYQLSVTAKSGAGQTVNDVMLGDVWLCSGQSNMALQVHRALDAWSQIRNSTNDSIRLLTVPQAGQATPQYDFASPVQWQKAGPTTVPEFSAACWYFARELQKTDNVAMGLIASAWGGSKIQAWMSAAALRALDDDMGEYNRGLDVLALTSSDPVTANAQWGQVWEAWWRERTADRRGSEPWSMKLSSGWQVAPRQLGHWEQWGAPELSSYNGMLWYRTTIKLSKRQAAQAATLSIGLVDEVDQTWVNGRPIGAAGLGQDRKYLLPEGTLRTGENVIVVNVLDTYAGGGLHGPAEGRALRFADGSSVLLEGEWRYRLPPTDIGSPPRAPWEAVAGLSVIYNGMIAPLANFGLRGVAWYQGESNTDEADRYQSLLTRFMADWRNQFGADLPVLVVQLANYGQPPSAPVESNWAHLREAQRRAVKGDAHAGLAVAIDIGDRYDIHPANKQEVGRRLARAARRVIYGNASPPSGPVAVNARREGDGVVVSFEDVSGRLITYSADAPIGFELCGAAPGTCQYADASIQNHRVVLSAANVTAAKRVRYCWAESPVCTLFDEAQLPAGPFEIEVQQ